MGIFWGVEYSPMNTLKNVGSHIYSMVKRKRPVRKAIWLTAEERKAAEDLKENIRLGLVDAPKDYDIYNEGIRSYRERLKAIKREIDARPKKAFNRDDYKTVPQEMWDHYKAAADAGEKPFMTDYQIALAKLRGEKVPAEDEFGFRKYPDTKPKDEHPHELDNIYVDQSDLAGLLEYYTLTIEGWNRLLPETQITLRSLYSAKTSQLGFALAG